MKFYVGSDFHADFWDMQKLFGVFRTLGIENSLYDGFLLCGDLCEWSDKGLYERVLKEFIDTKKPVFLVAGNHEFYGSIYDKTIDEMRENFKDISNLHILQDDFVDLEKQKIRIFGATLWTDFNDANEFVMQRATKFMNDYKNSQGLSPKLVLTEHKNSLEFLKNAYKSKPDDYKFVVMSHHSPSLKSSQIYHKMANASPNYSDFYFASDLEKWLDENQIYPDIWAFGHTHIAAEFLMCQKIKAVINSFGYRGKFGGEKTGYGAKFVEI